MELGFFIKLSEIPDLASKLEDPDFNRRLRENPAADLEEEFGIKAPEGVIPTTPVNLPTPERIAEIKAALAVLEDDDGVDFPWFPWIFRSAIPWFPGPWFWPWIRRPDSSE